MYEAQIEPILLYGAEVWGYQYNRAVENTYMFLCKRFLNVSMKTPNNMVLGDLGRCPVFVKTAEKCIRFWLRICNMPEKRLPKMAYNMLNQLQEVGKKTWAFYVRQLLCENGFGDVWIQQNAGDINTFLSIFRQRLTDQYAQTWHDKIVSSERFELYSSFKHSLQAERYLDYNIIRVYKAAYIKFRFGVSPILIHKLRYKKDVLPRHLLCPACKHNIEDECHILFECKAYASLRKSVAFLLDKADGNVSFVMSCDEEKSVKLLSRFLYHVFKRRLELKQLNELENANNE